MFPVRAKTDAHISPKNVRKLYEQNDSLSFAGQG